MEASALFLWMFSAKPAATETLPSLVCAPWRLAFWPSTPPVETLLLPLTLARPAPPPTMLSAWLSALPLSLLELLAVAPLALALETLLTVLSDSAPTYTPVAVTPRESMAVAVSLMMLMLKLPPAATLSPAELASALISCAASLRAKITTYFSASGSVVVFSLASVSSARAAPLPSLAWASLPLMSSASTGVIDMPPAEPALAVTLSVTFCLAITLMPSSVASLASVRSASSAMSAIVSAPVTATAMPAPTPVDAAFSPPEASAPVPKVTSALAPTSRLPPVRTILVLRVSLPTLFSL